MEIVIPYLEAGQAFQKIQCMNKTNKQTRNINEKLILMTWQCQLRWENVGDG